MPPPEPPGSARVLPMQFQIGDRMTDSSGEWEVVGRPYTTNGGKNAHVRVQRANQPGMTETKMWGAYEKGSVIRRAAAREGKGRSACGEPLGPPRRGGWLRRRRPPPGR